jgi:hypothetical protein
MGNGIDASDADERTVVSAVDRFIAVRDIEELVLVRLEETR